MAAFRFLFKALTLFLLPVLTTAQTKEDDLRNLALANNQYALNLYKQLTNGLSENMIFSPLSLSSAMAMLFAGAKGETAKELTEVLGYEKADLKEQQVHSAFHQFLTDVVQGEKNKTYKLNFANSIVVDKNSDVLSNYQDRMRDLYDATIRNLDFKSEAEQVVEEINDFVKNRSNGKIDKLLEKMPQDAAFIILNAVYFKGSWKTQFDPKMTSLQNFYNKGLESGRKKIQRMHLTANLFYTKMRNYEALELPYKGDNISMLILLPNRRDGLPALETSLTLDKLSEIRRQLRKRKVIVSLPKFKMQYSREMSQDMKSLGARMMFSPEADFSAMVASPNEVFVSQILHKAIVEVNEEGSEASAATGIVIQRRKKLTASPKFTADHPFQFAIIHKTSDMILFFGRVMTL